MSAPTMLETIDRLGRELAEARARETELAEALRETDNLVVQHHAATVMGATCEDGATCLVCHQQGALQMFGRNARLLREHRAALRSTPASEVAP